MRHLKGCPQRGAAAHAHEEPLHQGQTLGRGIGRAILYCDHVVQPRRLIDLGHDGLVHVLQPLDGVALHWLSAHDLDLGVGLLEAAGDAHQGAAGAHAGHEGGDLSVGLLQYLRGRGVVVGLPVGRVVELVGHVVALRVLIEDPLRAADGAVRALCRRG